MKKNYKDESPDRGLKRYIERVIEDKEAEEEIKQYKQEPDDDHDQEQISNNLR